MAKEEQTAEGPTPPSDGGGSGSGGPPPGETPLPTSCAGLNELLLQLQERLATERRRLEDTPKVRFRVRLQIQGGISLLNDMIGKVNAKRVEMGC